MKSVKHIGAAGLVSVLVMVGSGFGCSRSTDYGLGNTHDDHFSDSDRSTKVQDLKNDYSANIVIKDTSYADEHDVNRVLTYLAANEGTLKSQLQNVVEIDIVSPATGFTTGFGDSAESAVQWALNGTDKNQNATYSIAVNCSASESQLAAGFSKFASNYQGSAILNSAGARVGVRVVDMVGLSSNDASSFAQNLITAASGLDFTTPTAKEYVATIQIDSVFAVGNSGTVLVQSGASSDQIQSFLSSVLDLAKHLDQDLQTISTALGRNVTYQPNTLVPSEISQGIVSLRSAMSAIVNPKYVATPIMIGRRTETDQSIARSQNVLLIAFNASVADVTNAVSLLKNNNTGPITQVIAGVTADYAQVGVSFAPQTTDFGISDPTADGSLLVIQNAVKALEQAAPPATLQEDGVTAITVLQSWAGQTSTVTNGTLQTQLNPVNPDAISAALSQWVASQQATQTMATRQSEQASYLSALQAKYSNYNWSVQQPQSYDLSSADKTQELSSGAQAFEEVVKDGAIFGKIGITTIVVVKTASSVAESALVSADKTTLTIDLYLVTPKALSQALQAAVPPPAPPAPKPAPVPGAE